MEELKKNQTHIAEICGYASSGAGVCRIGGRAVFVDGTIEGEVWEILILKVSSSAVYGKAIKCIKSSPLRRESPCAVFGKCGGCDLMHMSYEEELRFKVMRVNDAMQRLGGTDFKIGGILAADEGGRTRYRNKGIYAVGNDNQGKTITGFFKERSHDIVPISDCLIQTQLSTDCASALREFMDLNNIPAYDEKSGQGLIRRLFTRCSLRRPQSIACIVSTDRLGKLEDALVEALLARCPSLTGIVLCVNKDKGNTVLKGDFYTLWGKDYIEDELCGLTFRISPMSFYQINPIQAEKLYNLALSYASPDGLGTVLDMYCGTGTISLCLARGAKRVIGAEIVEDAVKNARRNALENCIDNVEFICADASKAALELKSKNIHPDAVVVDPPRKGLAPDVVETISSMEPERIVYVSCDPATLARDIKRFGEQGYYPQEGMAVDMFPCTCNVETVALLSKGL